MTSPKPKPKLDSDARPSTLVIDDKMVQNIADVFGASPAAHDLIRLFLTLVADLTEALTLAQVAYKIGENSWSADTAIEHMRERGRAATARAEATNTGIPGEVLLWGLGQIVANPRRTR